jgi:hypothetical protein
MTVSSILAFAVREFHKVLPPTIFFIVGFNLVVIALLRTLSKPSTGRTQAIAGPS